MYCSSIWGLRGKRTEHAGEITGRYGRTKLIKAGYFAEVYSNVECEDNSVGFSIASKDVRYCVETGTEDVPNAIEVFAVL